MKIDKVKIYQIIILIALVLSGFVYFYLFRPEPAMNKLGPFQLGNVTKIEGRTVYIDVEGVEKNIELKLDVKVVRQVKDSEGIIKVIGATDKDIKINDVIVVYGDGEKIQILNE